MFYLSQFDKDLGWCEKLVNIAHNNISKTFDFTLSQGENENVRKILKPNQLFSQGLNINFSNKGYLIFKLSSDVLKTVKHGDSLEISPRSLVITNSLSELISKTNGAVLIIDYGENQSLSNSVRVWEFYCSFYEFYLRQLEIINSLIMKLSWFFPANAILVHT